MYSGAQALACAPDRRSSLPPTEGAAARCSQPAGCPVTGHPRPGPRRSAALARRLWPVRGAARLGAAPGAPGSPLRLGKCLVPPHLSASTAALPAGPRHFYRSGEHVFPSPLQVRYFHISSVIIRLFKRGGKRGKKKKRGGRRGSVAGGGAEITGFEEPVCKVSSNRFRLSAYSLL